MMVIGNLREPLPVLDPIDGDALRLGHHVEVAVVVVPDVLLVQTWNASRGTFALVLLAHVPIGHQIESIRIDTGGQQNDIIQETLGLSVVAADHLIDQFHQPLSSQHFSGVESTIDPNHRLSSRCQLASLIIGQISGQCQPPGDLLVLIQPLMILGRGNDRHPHRTTFGGFADLLERHPGRLLTEFLPIRYQLLVVCQ